MSEDAEFAERLAEQRRRLAAIRDGRQPAGPAESVDTVGTAGNGMITVTVRSGRVASVVAQRSVTDQPVRETGELIAEATNAALTEYRAAVPAAGDPLPDFAALGDRLREVEQQGGEFMRMIGTALEDVMAKVGERTSMHGNASPNFVEFLFRDTNEVLSAAQAAFDRPGATGSGEDEAEEVHATVDSSGAVSVVLSDTEPWSPARLGLAATEAINAALADWEARRRDIAPADPDELRKLADQAAALRTHSMEHLRGYTRNLNAIMGSIGEP